MLFNYRLIVAFQTSQTNWWVNVNAAIVGDGKCLSKSGQVMAGRTHKGVPSRQATTSHPEMPVRLDGWALVWMPHQPFIYSDNDNAAFAVVAGTFYWSIDLYAI